MPTHRTDFAELTLSALADLTGKAPETIRKRLDGLEPVRQDGRSRYYTTREALERIYTGDVSSVDRERARLLQAQAEGQEMKNLELRGELVRVEESEAVEVALSSAITARMMALPAALAEQCAAESAPARCYELLARAIRDALTSLADAELVEAEADSDPDPARVS